jgi:hypothetical protein
MAWAMATGANLNRNTQTGYQDSLTNNAVGPAIPQRMQDFMGVGMQRLNDKIVKDRQSNANRAAAAARATQSAPMQNATDIAAGNKSCSCE